MSTTLVAIAIDDDGRYVICSIGDSRAYLLRDGDVTQLTRDDSLVQDLIDAGTLTEEQARSHPQRSIVMRAIDGRETPHTRLSSRTARIGDRVLVCSDGVSDVLDALTLGLALGQGRPADAVAQLLDLAMSAGSRDNVSAVVADVVSTGSPSPGWAR